MKTLFFSTMTVSLLLCVSSCVKEKDLAQLQPPTISAADTSFSSLKAADNFSWSTTRQINFHFTASDQDDYQLVLKVLLPDGSVLLQKLQKANEDFQTTLDVPAHVTDITATYGSLTKTFASTDGAVNMTIN